MTTVKYDRGEYFIPLIRWNDSIMMNFDTGAQHTVISSSLLFRNIDLKKRKLLEDVLVNKSLQKFRSASGDVIHGVWCLLKDVKLGEIVVPNFYFNLILNAKRNIALLGNDVVNVP